LKSKKIWYISKYAGTPNKGGGPVRQYLFSKYFAIKGYETILISSNSNGFEYFNFSGDFKLIERPLFKHYILKGNKIALGFNIKRVISWLFFEYRVIKFFRMNKLHKEDTVIVSSLSILSFLTGVYFKKKYGLKLIVEVRDIWPLSLIELKNLSVKNLFIQVLSRIEKYGYSNADYIVGSMENLGEHVKNVCPDCRKKFRYIPMGLDSSILGGGKKIETKIQSDFIVGYAGTIGNANKVDLILETAELLKDDQNIKFKILGGGPLKSFFQKKYKHLNNVKFLKPVLKQEVGAFLERCDILLNPWENKSIYKYGISPNKWIDYMYAAKPIIVPYNGYKNIINEAECGEFIETDNPQLFAETILKYSKMPNEVLEEIGLNGKRYLEDNLTYDILSEKYLELINS